MDKDTFKIRLSSASESALKLAKQYSKNEIIDNFIYTIIPNSLDLSDYLTELEKENLKERKNELDKVFSANEVIDRLMIEDKVPLWINCYVIRANKKETTIELLTSRRFRNDSELMHKNERNPPFNSLIILPPYIFPYSIEKFDVNWRFNKIQTAIKLSKANRKLKTEKKKNQKLSTKYNLSFEEFCDSLKQKGEIVFVEKLKIAKQNTNNSLEGWIQFQEELNDLNRYSKLELTKNERKNLEFLLTQTTNIIQIRKKITTR